MSVSSSDCSMMPSMSSPRAVLGAVRRPVGRGLGQQPVQPGRATRRPGWAGRAARRRCRRPAGRPRWWPPGRRGRGRSGPPRPRAACPPRRTPPTARRWPGRSRPRRPAGRRPRRGDDEQRGVGGAQPGAQLADEVAVAGGVDQVDLDAVVQQRRDGQRDRALLADRGRVVVADRAAVDRRCRPGGSRRCAPAAPRPGSSSPTRRARPGPRCAPWPDRWRRTPATGPSPAVRHLL